MKTTVEIADSLLVQAKILAARRRWTLRRLLETALRAELKQSPSKPKRRPAWVIVDGPLAPDLDVSSREAMHRWLEKRE